MFWLRWAIPAVASQTKFWYAVAKSTRHITGLCHPDLARYHLPSFAPLMQPLVYQNRNIETHSTLRFLAPRQDFTTLPPVSVLCPDAKIVHTTNTYWHIETLWASTPPPRQDFSLLSLLSLPCPEDLKILSTQPTSIDTLRLVGPWVFCRPSKTLHF